MTNAFKIGDTVRAAGSKLKWTVSYVNKLRPGPSDPHNYSPGDPGLCACMRIDRGRQVVEVFAPELLTLIPKSEQIALKRAKNSRKLLRQ